ncbi:MAG: hypothetical protein M3Z08_16765 [Chloroflexota bacterium]|nr:hypothetical protein [Chloroflexota bacterium]
MQTIPLDLPVSKQPNRYTISAPATGKGRYVRQSSSADSFGIIILRLEPYTGPTPFLLVWQVTEEQIPWEFLPGVVQGIRQAAQQERAEDGWLTHIKVTVVDGAFHPVDSHARAYARATMLAFEDALTQTSLVPVETDS